MRKKGDREGVKKNPSSHHYHHLKRISQHAVSSLHYSVRKTQEINKSTKSGLFKYHVIVPQSKRTKNTICLQIKGENKTLQHSLFMSKDRGGMI